MKTITAIPMVAAVALILTIDAPAQTYVQQGNILDANPQLGSGGLNYGRRTYDFNAANRIVTGNVAGGASFRGFSPIRNPNALFLGGQNAAVGEDGIAVPSTTGVVGGTTRGLSYGQLPSDRLYEFQRDAAASGDFRQRRIYSRQPLPYYSTSSTVLNTGAITSRQNRPGTSQARSPYYIPSDPIRSQPVDPLAEARDSRVSSRLYVEPEIVRVDTGQRLTGDVNTRLARSPLFGNLRAVPMSQLASESAAGQGRALESGAYVDMRSERSRLVDLRVRPEPLDSRLPDGDPHSLENVLWGQSPVVDSTGPIRDWSEAGDVFTRMRMLADSGTGDRAEVTPPRTGPLPRVEGQEVGPGLRTEPDGTTPGVRPGTAAAGSLGAVSSFVGTEDSVTNRYLARGEELLKAGEYYRAASQFELAHVVNMDNPLPLLGKAMALLAAGDYRTSSLNLFQAIRQFEALGQFRIDLKSFVTDVKILDRRRVELENQLESFDDFRLRFLLGYAEYCSGLEEIGLANMARAAESVPDELSAVQDFVEDLRRQAAMRPAD